MGKGERARDNALSPEEMERLNRRSLDHQLEKIPLLQFDDIFANSETAQNSLFGKAFGAFNGMISSAQQAAEKNPVKQVVAALAGDRLFQRDTSENNRARELMEQRGMSQNQALAHNASAVAQGGDLNGDGASSNAEWARALGADANKDGKVSGQEWSQWKQANPDHRSAGGSVYSGLPNSEGVFAKPGYDYNGNRLDGNRSGGYRDIQRQYAEAQPNHLGQQQPPGQPHTQGVMPTVMPMAVGPGTTQPVRPVAGQPVTNPQSPGKGSGQKVQGYAQ
jgi:hypothetical protein